MPLQNAVLLLVSPQSERLDLNVHVAFVLHFMMLI